MAIGDIDILIQEQEGVTKRDEIARRILETQELAPTLELPEIGFYKKFDRNEALSSIDSLRAYISYRHGINKEVENSYEQSKLFINRIFDVYEGKLTLEEIFNLDFSEANSVFMVHARGEYLSEAIDHIPLLKFLDFENNMDMKLEKGDLEELKIERKQILRNVLGNLCPFVLSFDEELAPDGTRKVVGISVCSPQDLNLFQDLQELGVEALLEPDLFWDALKSIAKTKGGVIKRIKDAISFKAFENANLSINESALFSRRVTRGAVELLGLGAMLPIFTKLGKKVDSDRLGLQTTTGHTLTMIAILETQKKIFEMDGIEPYMPVNLGVVGAGYIGTSTLEVFLENFPNMTAMVYDVNIDKAKSKVEMLKEKFGDRVKLADAITELEQNTKYIVSAITGKVEVNDNYKNTTVIDDSEPEGYDPRKVDGVEGILTKPLFNMTNIKVGQSVVSVARRGLDYINKKVNNFDYGWREGDTDYSPGLASVERPGDTYFGCGAETYLYGFLKRMGLDISDLTVKDWVTAEHLKMVRNNPILKPIIDSMIPKVLQGGGILQNERIIKSSHLRKNFLHRSNAYIEFLAKQESA